MSFDKDISRELTYMNNPILWSLIPNLLITFILTFTSNLSPSLLDTKTKINLLRIWKYKF